MKRQPIMIILVLLAIFPLTNSDKFQIKTGKSAYAQNRMPGPSHGTPPPPPGPLSGPEQAAQRKEEMRKRLNLPIKHPVYPNTHRPPHRPPYYPPGNSHLWPRTTTVIREAPQQPVVIINNPPAEPAPPPKPEPKYLWVPPVMEKRTEPGHWEYGVKKTWMGDHWRFEQDRTEKTWIPEKEVEYVKEPGYWDTVE